MSLRTKPFKKNAEGYPMHELDGKVGYPVDHSIPDGIKGAKPGNPAIEGGAVGKIVPGNPGAGNQGVN